MEKPKFWKVCFAYLIDGIVCQIGGVIVGAIAGGIVGALLGVAGMYTPENLKTFAILTSLAGSIAGFVFFILYFTICECSWGQSIGKRAMGLTVVQQVNTK